jgi:hypothetical protein
VICFLCGLRYATIELFSMRGPCREDNQRKIINKENIDRERSRNFMKQSRYLLSFAEANLGQQKVNRIQLVQMRYLGTVKVYIFMALPAHSVPCLLFSSAIILS